ncbi:uncharacterized protein LOC106155567 [Lingula anatina]|uniref:Uncharacterized protein LOC106155567 n=1 Tax=Lingula anatina TaxID=7574 RepID=A0A1S3HII2_LINAN|nr:uncharacterized protein LOC106155567 [Lingula anatina]|eukprot:XP_013385903.1 uncharacterized protein LOC106155567 [Lingula anatina]
MPGEQLVCVWQAAFAQETDKGTKTLQHNSLKKTTAQLAHLQSVNYSDHKFNETFTDDAVTFDKYKTYVSKALAEKGFAPNVVFNDIERACWTMCREAYSSALPDKDLFHLWQVVNRLAQEGSYPPVVAPEERNWLSDKVASMLDKHWKTKDVTFKNQGATFQELVDKLNEVYFQESTSAAVHACIDKLHMLLVEAVLKTGWLYKRTRKQANWTNWNKRWFVLKPGCLEYYEQVASGEKGVNKKGEIMITKNTKLENTSNYRGVVHKLSGCFKISNLPMIECELGGTNFCKAERRAWLVSLEEVIDACKTKVTPVQKLLRELRQKRDEASEIHGLKEEKPNQAFKPPSPNPYPRPSPPKTKPKQIIPTEDALNNRGSSSEEEGEVYDNNNDKIKAVFVKIDRSGNGCIDRGEFSSFIHELGLNMPEKEVNMVFNTIDKDLDGRIEFAEFEDYFLRYIIDESGNGACVAALRAAFLEADRDGTGTLNFKQFAEYHWEKRRSIRVSKLFNAFNKMDKKEKGVITFTDFRDMHLREESELELPNLAEKMEKIDEEGESSVFERQLRKEYHDTDADQLAKYVRNRWDKFATFRRLGASGEPVMTGGHGMVADIVPGKYNLMDIACFSDLPPLIPKHTTVKGVRWASSTTPGKSGKVIFPNDFSGVIATDIATNEHLRYYGCSIADAQQEKISLLYRHGIQDFTYENKYLEDYVTSKNGGAGIEKHDFSHLDCPLDEDSGIFVLAKFVGDDELHVTGFKVPVRHTVYIPGGCIHSNDYLKGTWRTMLSDETDIDHVHLVQPSSDDMRGDFEHFKFHFA